MTLLETYIKFTKEWNLCFKQTRTLFRFIRQSLASLCTPGRKTITQAISFLCRDHLSWSSEYKLHSRSQWESEKLFQPIINKTVQYFSSNGFIAVAVDDTRMKKVGKKIPYAQYYRDPLSPPFHTNFIYGLRMLQASAILPLYKLAKGENTSPRGIPVRFTNVPVVKKPGKKATEAEKQNYLKMKKEHNLSIATLDILKDIRKSYDMAGAKDKPIIYACDGSFCNRTMVTAQLDRCYILARARKDAKLCFPANEGSRRIYSENKFTPENVRQDKSVSWKSSKVLSGGTYRKTKYKEVKNIFWQRGARNKPLRLVVIAPTPYKTTKNGKTYYRDAAYLLTTNMNISTQRLVQAYFDRWEIEVNHRDEKTILGVGEAQVRNPFSVLKQPAAIVASYSMLLLAALSCFGPHRKDSYLPLPKWRRKARRPSCQDMVNLLRKELTENKKCVSELDVDIDPIISLIKSAA
jgi:hypothetical protein